MKRWGVVALFAVGVFASNGGSAQAAAESGTPEVAGTVPKCEGDKQYGTAAAKVTTYLDGGSSYTYRYGDGSMTMTIGQPPDGFQPEKASDGELAQYGFPPRPANEKGLREWGELMSSYKSAAPPVACEGAVPPSLDNSSQVEYETKYAKGWSGYVAESVPAPHRFVAVRGNFYEPSGNAYASCKSNALVSNWVGLGGRNTERLIQTGTGVATNDVHSAWFAEVSGASYYQVNFPELAFGAGSFMEFYAGYNLAESKAYFYLENGSTGQTIPVVAPLGSKFYDGSTAESITERPGNGAGGKYPLLNFNYMTWWNVTVQDELNYVYEMEALIHSRLVMTNTGTSTGTLLANPGGLSVGQNYPNTYYGCQ